MSVKIWLIAEDPSDAEIVKTILKAKKNSCEVRLANDVKSGRGGITRLVEELDLLIQSIKLQKNKRDFIVVLYDEDKHEPNRDPYNKIKTICEAYKSDVIPIIARDAIESWLLADEGICKWLEIPQKSWDEVVKPKNELISLLNKKKKLKYQGRGIDKVLEKVNGTGDKVSESMKKATAHLARCKA